MPAFDTTNLFAKLPQEIIFNENLTAGEVRLIAALMVFDFLDGGKKSEFGSYKIAEKMNTSPAAIRRLLKDLEEKRYIKITNQDFNGRKKSSKIELTLNSGIYFALVGAQNKTSERNQNDSSLRNQNDSILRNQNDSKKNQNDSTHIEERKKDIKEIKEKNQNDSTNEQSETGDSAPVRSMPEKNQQGYLEAAQLDICDIELVEKLKPLLKKNNYLSLTKIFDVDQSDYVYTVTACTNFCDKLLQKEFPAMEAAAAEIGRKLRLGKKCTFNPSAQDIDYKHFL